MDGSETIVRSYLTPAAYRVHRAKAHKVGLLRAAPDMDDAEAVAILWYTSRSSKSFLERLRHESATEGDLDMASVLASAILKLPLFTGSVIDRVITVDSTDMPRFIATYVKGKVVTWPVITSCSSSNAFRGFGNATFLISHRSGHVIGHHSWYPHEDEVILPAGCSFTVASTVRMAGGDDIEVELIEIA